jgi:glycosyltransferase involved in cell wall biosynthesis
MISKMNIILLTDGFMKNKKESVYITLTTLGKELIKKGHDTIIIANGNNNLPRVHKVEGVPIYRAPKKMSTNRLIRILTTGIFIRKLEKLKGKKYHVINNFSSAPILALRAIITKLFSPKIKVVQSIKSYSKSYWGNHFFRILNLAEAVTFPTERFKDQAISRGVKKKKIEVINSYIDIKKFLPKNKKELKRRYGFKENKIVLYYGALWKEKGVKFLVSAIPDITKLNPKTIFIFAPRETEKFILRQKKLVDSIKKHKNSRFITKDINIVDYVNMADAVVLPYIKGFRGTEGNPSCLLEAMACKTPVVTSNLPELREIVTHEKEVLLAEPENSNSIAENVNRILMDKLILKTIIQNAYEKSKIFDIERITEEFIALYKKVLKDSNNLK